LQRDESGGSNVSDNTDNKSEEKEKENVLQQDTEVMRESTPRAKTKSREDARNL